MTTYDIGDTARVSAAFTNGSSQAADPTGVTVEIKNPAGTKTTYTYGTDAALVRDSVGNYHLDVAVDVAGMWYYRWVGTGAVVTASESNFSVRRSYLS